MIALGSDHGGFELKKEIMAHLDKLGEEYADCGTYSAESCDYPDFADAVCVKIQSGQAERGILICGTGIGMSMAANKHRGIRAAVCGDCFSAKYTRAHNDANVLCLGARVTGPGLAMELVDMFLKTPFDGGRHTGRVAKIMALEDR